MKKILIPLFAAGLLAIACAPSNAQNNLPFAPGSQPAANLYAFQAATSIGLIGNVSSAQPNVRMAKGEADQVIIDQIKSYLPAVEAALSGMDALTSAQEEKSDLPEYETKLTISYTDIALKDNTFIMYYNETVEGEEVLPNDTTTETLPEENTTENSEELPNENTTEIVEPEVNPETTTEPVGNEETTQPVEETPLSAIHMEKDDDEDDEEETDEEEADEEDDDDEEETEQESSIDGIIIVGDNTFPMTGEKELDPVENEYEVSFSYFMDENTLVTVEQEIEGNQTEFEYAIESNGETIYEYSIELGENEVELEVEEQGVAQAEYSFELVEKDGKTLIKASYEYGKDEVEVLFDKVINEDQTVDYIVVE